MATTYSNSYRKKESSVFTRYLSALEVAADINPETRTIRFPFSSEQPVERWAFSDDLPEGASFVFDEVLPSDPQYWDLSRVNNGVCLFLQNHDRDKRLGKVLSVDFSGDKVYATIKLRKVQLSDDYISDLNNNTCGGASFGYIVKKYRVASPAEYDGDGWDKVLTKKAVLEATEIELLEVSDESIPADSTVGPFHKQAVNMRSVVIDGDPGFEFPNLISEAIMQRAKHEDLKVGDYVGWKSGTSSKAMSMNTYGKVEKKAVSGTISPSEGDLEMDCSPDNPGFLVSVHKPNDDGEWEKTDTRVVHRADNLTKLDKLPDMPSGKKSVSSNEHVEERAADASKWFPLDYANNLKEKYPQIWKLGGNDRGNEAFELAQKYKSGDRTDAVMEWYDTERPAWIARHYDDHLLPGVIAQIKWLTVGTLGVDGMKQLVDDRKQKEDDKDKEKAMELEQLRKENEELRRQLGEQPQEWRSHLSDLQTQMRSLQDELKQRDNQLQERDKELQQRNEQLQQLDAQMNALNRSSTVNKRYGQLRKKAEALLQEAKITAVEFGDIFGEKSEDDIDRLLKSEAIEADLEMGNIEFYLRTVEKRSPILNTQIRSGQAPLPKREEPETEEEKVLNEARQRAAEGYTTAWRHR